MGWGGGEGGREQEGGLITGGSDLQENVESGIPSMTGFGSKSKFCNRTQCFAVEKCRVA